MTEDKSEITKTKVEKTTPLVRRPFDDIFENFRRDIEEAFVGPWWPRRWEMRLPSFGTELDARMPLCDMVDKGDKYEVSLEVPGIPKEKIDIKATKYKVEVSGQQEKKTEDKGRNYVYNERSYQSFNRRIPFQMKFFHQRSMRKWKMASLRLIFQRRLQQRWMKKRPK